MSSEKGLGCVSEVQGNLEKERVSADAENLSWEMTSCLIEINTGRVQMTKTDVLKNQRTKYKKGSQRVLEVGLVSKRGEVIRGRK